MSAGATGSDSKPSAPAPAPDGGGKGGGGGGLPMILTIVNLVVTLGILAVLFISFKKENSKARVEDIAAQDGHGEEAAEGGHGGGHGGGGEHGGGHGGGHGEKAKKKNLDFGKMVTLEQFTVNLSTPGSPTPKFFRVNISLEVPSEDAEAELTAKMPQARNAIIDLINSKKPSDLAGSEGREYLKEEIKSAINSFIVNGKVKAVFFTNFSVSG